MSAVDLSTKYPLSPTISGSCDHNGGVLTSKDGDLKLTIPKGAIKDGDLVTLCLASDLYGPFVLPSKHQANVVSPYYWIEVSRSYCFYKPIQVEFQHFAVVSACDPSHFQLLCCEDNDESYTMQPVDYELSFTVQDDISWCSFYTDHFCSYCLFPGCKDPIINRIAAIYLKTKNYQCLTHFTAEIWFSFPVKQCLKRNEELYTQEGMVLDKKYCYIFEASCDKHSASYFTLLYQQDVTGWNLKHSLSTKVNTKTVNFYNYYTDRDDLIASEENGLFPQRLIVDATRKSDCNTDLNTEIMITLHKSEGEILEAIPLKLFAPVSAFVKMITNRPSLSGT